MKKANKKKQKKYKFEIENIINFSIIDNNQELDNLHLLDNENEEQKMGDKEFIKVLQKALKDALDKNDILRNYVSELNTENEKLKKENDEKDDVIKELGDYYELCQKKHIRTKTKKKRKNKKEKEKEES
jgi:hypothetical protein